ncbi:MAG: TIM barrel protein [Phenylobacterium sp.]|jgi:hydroxypyruvate isomerase|nr:TIM barrel protein [Phenylobacterium sp.]MDZ4319013.1 TIM barrel protein [Phenylobacterium sp.]
MSGFRQSFAWWSFTAGREVDGPAFLARMAAAGAQGVEMAPEALWPAARNAGLALVTLTGHQPLEVGFNDRDNHLKLQDKVRASIALAQTHGVEKVIVFSGDRKGRADAEGIANTVEGLAPLAQEAEAAGVMLLLELLNSKVDHPDQQCDHTAWGAQVVTQVNSPALRLLYDAYHMQLMEGDLLRTIRANLPLIGHIHTGGAPGRRDLDDRQEIHWPAVAGLLRHLGYEGWVGHEFIPRDDPIGALRQAMDHFGGPRA